MTTKLLAAGNMSGEKYQQMVHIIQRAAERMNRLIEDLMAVARVREGQRIPLDLHSEDPGEIVGEACEVFNVQARAKGIALRCESGDGISRVKADRHRLDRPEYRRDQADAPAKKLRNQKKDQERRKGSKEGYRKT